jgi:N-methylhydantoinase B
MSGVDSLTVAVVWGRLVGIAEEMGQTVRHTAYSDAIREGRDFSAAVFDREGRLLAQADLSPGHLGAMPFAVVNILRVYPAESLTPGDVIIMNDPYLGSGHLPDFYCLSPVFVDDGLVGFAVTSAHLVDVGGIRPGSQAVEGVTELFQEGIRFPPTALYEAGKPKDAIFRILEANVRVPHKVIGDLRAQRNALYTGAAGYAAMVRRYGLPTLAEAAKRFLDHSEQAVRMELQKIPDGSYTFTDHLDDVGPGSRPVRMTVTVTVSGSDITFDFTGSDAQTASAINSPINFTRAYCYWAAKAITTGNTIPQNAGQLRPVRVTAPPGTFFNPTPPAAAGGRAVLNQRIVELIFGALAPIIPDHISAASGQWCNPTFGGTDPRTGRRFVFYDYIVGGIGARRFSDGVSAMSPVFSLENVPIEVQEAEYPVLVERFELMQDSGGAGRTRGGLSLRKDIRILSTDTQVSNLSDRYRCRPYGVHGGDPGQLGATVLNPGTQEERILESKGTYMLAPGDVISFRCSGSGGFGPPTARDREAVRRDLQEGYISPDVARLTYGFQC